MLITCHSDIQDIKIWFKKCILDNQVKDLRMQKDKKRFPQTRKENSAKRELENARKKARFWREQDLRIARKRNFSIFLNLKVDIFFGTLYKEKYFFRIKFPFEL